MRLIIAGTRDIKTTENMLNVIIHYLGLDDHVDEIVSGGEFGLDIAGEKYAEQWNFPCKVFFTNWEKFGRTANFVKNKQMAQYADALLLIWNGESKGSANLKFCMDQLGKPVYEIIIKTPYKE